MRSTLLRLDRQRDASVSGPGVDLLQRTYDELASAVLDAGVQRGYLGRDPLGALVQLNTPDVHTVQLSQLALDLWHAFFNTFRPDELDFEAKRFREAAAELEQALSQQTPGSAPPAELALRLLAALLELWEDRQDAVNQRLDLLIGELTDKQHLLGSSDLQRAYQEDELGQATRLVGEVLRDLRVSSSADEPLSKLLAKLVKVWRSELQKRSRAADQVRTEHAEMMSALSDVAVGRDAGDARKQLDRPARVLIDAVSDLVAANRELESEQRNTQQRLAQLEAERQEFSHELASRDQLLARYEFSEGNDDDHDQRLELYRSIVAAFERGEQPHDQIEAVRDLERVFVLSMTDQQQALVLIDRMLESVAKSLGDLRRIMPLTEDPKRYRPRLLGSSKYRLKTVPGMLQASRDAGRDALSYAARMRWAAGVNVLAREFKKLRKIFAEMVRLVEEARESLGGAPPASISIDIGSANGLASLPAALAVDLRGLIRARGGAKVFGAVAELLEECVSLFHAALVKAKGEDIERSIKPKRESGAKQITRLTDELLELAGTMEAVFAEAKANGWELRHDESALLNQDQTLLMAIRDLDGICDVILALPGAPEVTFPRVPKGGSRSRTLTADVDRLLAAVRSRVTWLEEVARYRVEVAT